jgi:hypothetical protein
MYIPIPPANRFVPRQLAAAANGIVTAWFSLAGFDVQNHSSEESAPFDLIIEKPGIKLQVSVMGTNTGYWALTELRQAGKNVSHQEAVQTWLEQNGTRTVFALVRFHSTDPNTMPRVYLASTVEIAQRMMKAIELLGEPVLYESFETTNGADGHHTVEQFPNEWRFSEARVRVLAAHPRFLMERREFLVPPGMGCIALPEIHAESVNVLRSGL